MLAGEKDWTRSTEFRCKELTYTVTGLTEGADYYIRVIAVNDAGPGAPGVTEPVTVKEPEGTDLSLLPFYLGSFIVLTFSVLMRIMTLCYSFCYSITLLTITILVLRISNQIQHVL